MHEHQRLLPLSSEDGKARSVEEATSRPSPLEPENAAEAKQRQERLEEATRNKGKEEGGSERVKE